MRDVSAVAGLIGGLCWIGVLWVDALAVLGAVLLAVGVLGAGAGLVSRSAGWLRVVAAVCFLALVGSVVQVLRDNLGHEPVLAAGGVVAVVVGAYALARRPVPESRTRRRGAHAA